MKTQFLAVAFMTTSFIAQAFAFETVAIMSGEGRAADGDGVLFGEVEVRLQGIAAPEDNHRKTEPGGKESTENLRQLVDGNLVVCHLDGTVTKGKRKRPVGVCFVGTTEINHHQVLTGHARDCPKFSKGRYQNAETQARLSGADLSQIYPLPGYCR